MGKGFEVNKKEGSVRININPKIYSMGVIYSTAHSFTGKSYVLLDGDREKNVAVELKPFENRNLEALGREFGNRLLSHQLYEHKRKENSAIRQLFLYRAIMTNAPEEAMHSRKRKK